MNIDSQKMGSSRQIIIASAVVLFFCVNVAGYFAVNHRRAQALVRLDSSPLPSASNSLNKTLSFKVAVSNILAPMKSYNSYQGIANKLAQGLGLPLELVIAKSCSESSELLSKNEVDLAFACAGSPASAPQAMDVIAAGVVDGKPVFHSLIIVPFDSKAMSVSDLKGQSFLFTDPDSLSGYWYVEKRLVELGEDPKTFFGQVKWSESHDHSILAISQNMAQGASVSSVVYNLMLKKDRSLRDRVRIIEESPPLPSPPVVVRKNMPVKERNLVRNILFHLAETDEGRETLSEIGIEGFVPASNDFYTTLKPPEVNP